MPRWCHRKGAFPAWRVVIRCVPGWRTRWSADIVTGWRGADGGRVGGRWRLHWSRAFAGHVPGWFGRHTLALTVPPTSEGVRVRQKWRTDAPLSEPSAGPRNSQERSRTLQRRQWISCLLAGTEATTAGGRLRAQGTLRNAEERSRMFTGDPLQRPGWTPKHGAPLCLCSSHDRLAPRCLRHLRHTFRTSRSWPPPPLLRDVVGPVLHDDGAAC